MGREKNQNYQIGVNLVCLPSCDSLLNFDGCWPGQTMPKCTSNYPKGCATRGICTHPLQWPAIDEISIFGPRWTRTWTWYHTGQTKCSYSQCDPYLGLRDPLNNHVMSCAHDQTKAQDSNNRIHQSRPIWTRLAIYWISTHVFLFLFFFFFIEKKISLKEQKSEQTKRSYLIPGQENC